MNCRRVISLMSAYVDGELTGVEMLEIRRHLSECRECAEEYEAVRMTKLMVSRLRTMAPRENLAVAIVTKLDEVRVPPYQRLFNSMFRYVHNRLSPVAAALAMSGFALVVVSAGGVDRVATTQEELPTPVQTVSYRNASFVSEGYASSASFSSEPLKLASYSPEPGGGAVRFAGLATR